MARSVKLVGTNLFEQFLCRKATKCKAAYTVCSEQHTTELSKNSCANIQGHRWNSSMTARFLQGHGSTAAASLTAHDFCILHQDEDATHYRSASRVLAKLSQWRLSQSQEAEQISSNCAKLPTRLSTLHKILQPSESVQRCLNEDISSCCDVPIRPLALKKRSFSVPPPSNSSPHLQPSRRCIHTDASAGVCCCPLRYSLSLPSLRPNIRGAVTFTGGGAGLQGAAEAASEPGQSADLPMEPSAPPLNPQKLAEPDLVNLFIDIRKELSCSQKALEDIACYYFDGQGKVIRPVIAVLVARALNNHVRRNSRLLRSQLEIAKVTEMIHTASLLHDDVLDRADTRRGKDSVTKKYGQRMSVMAGDYVLSVASMMLAALSNPQVTIVLSQVLTDLVQGEFMQLGSKEKESERFTHYLSKTFKKTASLIAYSCQAVAILGGADDTLQQVCFQYGKNVGIAFQLVDDLLDFVSSTSIAGKPTSVDLKLGMATAPVLFASETFPELHPLILRRFSNPGDVDFAYQCVLNSEGLKKTKLLAKQHCLRAIQQLQGLDNCVEKDALMAITDQVLHRIR